MDLIEEKFASDEFGRRVREMEEQARTSIDKESRELILVGHALAIANGTGQIFRLTSEAGRGIDGEIEFKDDQGEASGKRVYLQLKFSDTYRQTWRSDGKEVFTFTDPRDAECWHAQEHPVMLVIRTSEGRVRWMNVTEYLRRQGTKIPQIVFDGEPFTALNIVRLRDRLFRG